MLNPARARLLECYTDWVNATCKSEVTAFLQKWPCKIPSEFHEIERLFLTLEERVVKDPALLGPPANEPVVAEVQRLRKLIEDTAKQWQRIEGIPFEGGIDAAMRAAVDEIWRLRAELARVVDQEVKPLRERIEQVEKEASRTGSELARVKTEKDGAYQERDRLVCALSKLFRAWLAQHPDTDTSWDKDWRWIVFVQLPIGQVSWHIHASERDWFDHLPVGGPLWDGHTTAEKYYRVAMLSPKPRAGWSGPDEEREPTVQADLFDVKFGKVSTPPPVGDRLIKVKGYGAALVNDKAAEKLLPPVDVLGEKFRTEMEALRIDADAPSSVYETIKELARVVARIGQAQRAGGAE